MWYLIVSIPDLCTLTYFKGRQTDEVDHDFFEEMGQNAFAIGKEKRKFSNAVEAPSEEANNTSGSIVKGTFKSLTDKQKIIKVTQKLRKFNSDMINAANIFI